MRQIALDTETTGLSTELGHRIIEIGCVELCDRKLTGNTFHCYLNPGREVEAGAYAIHGISNEFLSDKPKFNEVMEPLINFIQDAELIIHNAPFDVGFINYELQLSGKTEQVHNYCTVFDTLTFARKQHPGQKNNLDALCKRYEVDNSHRQFHGALLDADLLARLYLMMTGGQVALFGDSETAKITEEGKFALNNLVRNKPLVVSQVSEQELLAHQEFIEILKKSGSNLWEDID
jgi:DNA polymerase-3 subunit epsilon